MNEEYKDTDKIKLIDTKKLQEMLCCSYNTAVKIGMKAGARIRYGRAIRWRVQSISEYLDALQKEAQA